MELEETAPPLPNVVVRGGTAAGGSVSNLLECYIFFTHMESNLIFRYPAATSGSRNRLWRINKWLFPESQAEKVFYV